MEQLFWGRVPVKHSYVAYLYKKGSPIARLVQGLKYKNKPQLGVTMGEMMTKEIQQYPDFEIPDAIIPMPLHPKKKYKRGYNQSEKICEGIANCITAEVRNDLLLRKTHNVTQTKKHQFERWDNVSDIFHVAKKTDINTVLLVDDVVTTGATLESAAKTLIKEGYEVSIATFAITTHE